MLADKFAPADEYVRFSSVYKDPGVVDKIDLDCIPEHHLEMPLFYSVCKQRDGGFTYMTKLTALVQNYQVSDLDGFRYFTAGSGDGTPRAGRPDHGHTGVAPQKPVQ